MNEKRKESTGALWKKEVDVLNATDAALDLCIDGHASVWLLVRYVFYSQWLSFERWGLDLAKAIPAFLRRKDSFAVFWTAFYTNVISKVMEASAEQSHPQFAEVMMQLKDTNEVVLRRIIAFENEPNITAAAYWQNAALLFTVNSRRFKCSLKDRQPRLRWKNVQFIHEYNEATMSDSIRATALTGLTANESLALLTDDQKSKHLKLSGDGTLVTCTKCGGVGHYANKCPKKKTPPKKTTPPKRRFKDLDGQEERDNGRDALRSMRKTMTEFNGVIGGLRKSLAKFGSSMNQTQLSQPKNKRVRIDEDEAPEPKHQFTTSRQNQDPMRNAGAHFYTPSGALKQRYRGTPACKFFSGQWNRACRFDPKDCRHPHYCEQCGSTDHGKKDCDQAQAQRM